jgi:hypothetical protein
MWLQRLRRLVAIYSGKTTRVRRARKPRLRRPTLLTLELLENRVTPSTLYVTNLNDSAQYTPGDGSLRGEIAAANPGDTIGFGGPLTGVGGSINLTAGPLLLNKSLTLVGNGSPGNPAVVVNAGNASRVFDVEGGAGGVNVTLQYLKITGGVAGPAAANVADAGGGVLVNDTAGGTVTLDNVVVIGNQAVGGAGANGSAFSAGGAGQSGQGGGVYFAGGNGTLVLTNSTLSNNVAQGGGGGVGGSGFYGFNPGYVGGAGGVGQGGGLYVAGGNVQLANDALAGNSAAGGGCANGGERGVGGS